MNADGDAIARMVSGYEPLLRGFITGTIPGDEFETTFIEYFKSDKAQVRSPELDVINNVFYDVDEYVADPDLRARAGGPGDEWLRERLREAYRRLYGKECT